MVTVWFCVVVVEWCGFVEMMVLCCGNDFMIAKKNKRNVEKELKNSKQNQGSTVGGGW